MIYFLTDWQTEIEKLETNITFNVNKIFSMGDIESKIINIQFSPFLSYFANQFEIYDSDGLVNLLNIITEKFALNYAPLSMNDLQLSGDYEKTYTRTNVLLSKNGDIKGEIYFNQFGFVSQVHYFSEVGKEVQIYSDKGYILCKQFSNQLGEKIERQVFDEGGQLIFTERHDCVLIGSSYKNHFKQETYNTFEEICIELLNITLTNFNPEEDRIIIDATNSWLMNIVEGFMFPEAIIYVFSGNTKKCMNQIDSHMGIIKKGKNIITDNTFLHKRIETNNNYRSIKTKLNVIPLFPTTLSLGESNTYAEQYVYWQIKQLDFQTRATLLDFLFMKRKISDFCLIINSQNIEDEVEVQKIVDSFIRQNFKVDLTSPEYELVKNYYEALENEEMTVGLSNLFSTAKQESPEFIRVIEAYLFYTGITFRKNQSIQALKEDFSKTRVFVDQRTEYEFFIHSLAVSSGIPIISKQPSPYLIEEKNGVVFQTNEQLVSLVEEFLRNTDKWNQNLVECVDVIQDCSAYGLLDRWKEGLR